MADVYSIVTDRIVALLEAGTVPWRKPWRASEHAGSVGPRNVTSGKLYRGVNAFLLGCAGYSSPWWLTYKQAQALGGYVKRGERGLPVIFWKVDRNGEVDPETGKRRQRFILRYSTAFNVEQTEGCKLPARCTVVEAPEAAPEAPAPIEACEAIVAGFVGGPPIEHHGAAAFYAPLLDRVTLPPREAFDSPEAYYAVAFHELGHSTGHAKRLAREGVTNVARFGSHTYSREELVAECTSAFLCAVAGIDTAPVVDNAAAYCASWIKVLRADPRAVVTAAAQAQKAADLILGKSYGDEQATASTDAGAEE